MTAPAIAPFPDFPMTVQQDSVSLALGSILVQFDQAIRDGKHSPVLDSLIQPLDVSAGTIDAFQRLTQLLQQLGTDPRSPQAGSLCPEDLVPYVTEEALDVLDALQTTPGPLEKAVLPSPLIRLESLVAPILWAIARHAYPVMELLEGTRASARWPGQSWCSGVLRLVPLLEISTPDQYWRFDLTTSQEPQHITDPGLQLQLEKELKPQGQPAATAQSSSTIHSANQHLQDLQQGLAVGHPTLQALFHGMMIDLLPPRSSWLRGELKLHLDFEFVAQEITDFIPSFQPFQDSYVEAELLEEQAEIAMSTPVDPAAAVSLAVIELPLSLLEPTTLIRVADGSLLEHLTQYAHQQRIKDAIAPIQSLIQSSTASDPVLTLVRSVRSLADFSDESAQQTMPQTFSLLQPEQLMDELVPKLLWQVSRGSFTVMQWVGGMPVTLLQPGCDWEMGTLRLMAVLQLGSGDRSWHIDLATGRFISDQSWQFNPDAVVSVWDEGLHCSAQAFSHAFPLQVGALLEQLQSLVQRTAPETELLQKAIAVEWLSLEQEWRSGELGLHWGFTWMPDMD